MKVLTKALIKESEKNAVESGAFSYLELMKRAGSAAAEWILKRYDLKGKRVAVICGNGNNGGDGFVIAKHLYEALAEVTVVTPMGEPVTENAKYYFDNLSPLTAMDEFPKDREFDFIIDALFGIGLNRAPNSRLTELIEHCNSLKAVRIAVDIPSGVECDTGKVFTNAFASDYTLTFIALKPCFFLPCGLDYCGATEVLDIGAEPCGYSYLINQKPILLKRKRNSHKGSFGTALLICGSYGMAGAAILAARSALKSGVGIAKCVLCEGIYSVFTSALPEAVCIPLKQTKSGILKADKINVNKLLKDCDSVLIGCGLGKGKTLVRLIKRVAARTQVPLIIDADGINNMCGSIELLRKCKAPVIITPHPGEMARLLGVTVKSVEANRIAAARDFSLKYGCYTVLKGAYTLIAEPRGEITINTTGNPGMATGGSGDVLSGIIASLLAQGMSPADGVKAAVYLHGEAGDKAALREGERGMLPSDIIEEL